MITATKTRGRTFRWCVRALGVLVVLFLLASLVLYGLARTAESRWDRLASELRAKGQPLTYAEIEATKPPLADGANGVVAIREAARILESFTEPDESGVLLLDSECEADFFKGIERRCLPPTRTYLETRRQVLTRLSEITHYADVRLDVSYDGTMFDRSSRVLKILLRHRALGRLLYLDAFLKTIDGDVAGAVDAIVLQLRLSEPLYAEPENILQLRAIANDWLVVTAFEGLLQSHELGDGELERLQLECNRHLRHQTLEASLLGTRASFIRMTDKDDWFIYENRFQGVTILTRLLDASDDLSKLLRVARHEEASLSRFAPGQLLIRILLPSLTHGIELHARTAARFRCIPVAVAAERFRLANSRFPGALDELVPAYLAEVPRDPFGGKPIRITRTDSGMVVYSIGENMVDAGGKVMPEGGERFGRDFGIRLMEPKERGLRLIGAAATAD